MLLKLYFNKINMFRLILALFLLIILFGILSNFTFIVNQNNGRFIEIITYSQLHNNYNFNKTELEYDILENINDAREEINEDNLTYDPVLSLIARNYAKRMFYKKFFEHRDPYTGYTVKDRLKTKGIYYPLIAENLVYLKNIQVDSNFVSRKMFDLWMQSKEHRKNMLNPKFNRCGVGVYCENNTCYGVTIFASNKFESKINISYNKLLELNLIPKEYNFSEVNVSIKCNNPIHVNVLVSKEDVINFEEGYGFKEIYESNGPHINFKITIPPGSYIVFKEFNENLIASCNVKIEYYY